MSLSEIHNYLPINEHVATAGQPTEAPFHKVCDAGFAVVINLAPDALLNRNWGAREDFQIDKSRKNFFAAARRRWTTTKCQ